MEIAVQTVIIVEDDVMIAEILEEFLIDGGYTVCANVRTVAKAIEKAAEFKPDLFVLDMQLADNGFGSEVAAQIDRSYNPGIIYATGSGTMQDLTQENGHAYISKPYRCKDILLGLAIATDLVKNGTTSIQPTRNVHILPAKAEVNKAA
jgi:CheY-like chemotaxis protein